MNRAASQDRLNEVVDGEEGDSSHKINDPDTKVSKPDNATAIEAKDEDKYSDFKEEWNFRVDFNASSFLVRFVLL